MGADRVMGSHAEKVGNDHEPLGSGRVCAQGRERTDESVLEFEEGVMGVRGEVSEAVHIAQLPNVVRKDGQKEVRQERSEVFRETQKERRREAPDDIAEEEGRMKGDGHGKKMLPIKVTRGESESKLRIAGVRSYAHLSQRLFQRNGSADEYRVFTWGVFPKPPPLLILTSIAAENGAFQSAHSPIPTYRYSSSGECG